MDEASLDGRHEDGLCHLHEDGHRQDADDAAGAVAGDGVHGVIDPGGLAGRRRDLRARMMAERRR